MPSTANSRFLLAGTRIAYSTSRSSSVVDLGLGERRIGAKGDMLVFRLLASDLWHEQLVPVVALCSNHLTRYSPAHSPCGRCGPRSVFVLVAPRKDSRATRDRTVGAVPRNIALGLLLGFSLPPKTLGAVGDDELLGDQHVAVVIAPLAQSK
jgi:hypothetical protein